MKLGLFGLLVTLLFALSGAPAMAKSDASVSPSAGARTISLEEAYDMALATDQAIRIAYWEVRKANLLPWSALTRLGPSVTGSAGYNRNGNTTILPTRNKGGTRTDFDTFESHSGAGFGSMSFDQPLIDLTVFPAYKLGKISAEVARLEHQFTIRETLFGVATAYFEVLKQQRLVVVNQLTFQLSNEQLTLAQKRANAGEVTPTDILRAQVTLETARQALVAAENTLELDRNTLGNILNLPVDTKFDVSEPQDYPTEVPAFSSLLQRAYDHREDLRVKILGIDQDTQRKNQVIAEYGPRVVLQGSTEISNDTGSSRSNSRTWSAGISVQVPFLTGGQREIDLITARHQIEESKLARDQTMKTVESDAKQAWLTVRTLEVTLKASKVQVEAAEQAYKDLQAQYAASSATSVDVLSGLNDLNNARKNLAQQTYDYQVALRNLEQVSGVFQEKRVSKTKVR